jgi:hypothetical protein
MSIIGAVSHYRDSKKEFYSEYYKPVADVLPAKEILEPQGVFLE